MSTPDEPIPSTSKDYLDPNTLSFENPSATDDPPENDEITKEDETIANEEKQLDKIVSLEEFLLKSRTYMLDYEKTMFLDAIDSDCLVVCAK